MNRIFHIKTNFYVYIYIIVLAILVFAMLWHKKPLIALPLAVMLIIIIDKTIKGTYTITTNGNLIVYQGTFRSKIILPLQSVTKIERIRKYGISVVVLHYDYCKHIGLTPLKEDEFIRMIEKFNKDNDKEIL